MASRDSKVLPIDDDPNVDAGVTSVAISPDARFVATGSLDTVVRIWDIATGTLVDCIRGHGDSIYSVALTPDGKGLVSGSLDKTLKYWELNTAINQTGERFGKSVLDLTGHKDYVLSVAISHDGQWVVSGSKDRSVRFWDKNGRAQLMLQAHKNSGECRLSRLGYKFSVFDAIAIRPVISVDLSPNGGYLATGSGDWQARVCKSLHIHTPRHAPFHSHLLIFPLLYFCSLIGTHRELLRRVISRTPVDRHTHCNIGGILLYIIWVAVGAREHALASTDLRFGLWRGRYHPIKSNRGWVLW